MRDALYASGLAAILAFSGNAQATLFDRGNGLIYDDVLNVTWLQNANLAATDTFGLPYNANLGNHPADGAGPQYTERIGTNGAMTWGAALHWIDAMNSANYLGYSNWRLPAVIDTGTVGCNFSNGGTDCGYNVQTYSSGTAYSELAYMYAVNLGLTSHYNPDGSLRSDWGIFGNGTSNGVSGWPYGQNDVGLITNLQGLDYWTGTENLAPNNVVSGAFIGVYSFQTNDGYQSNSAKWNAFYAWALRDGDVAPSAAPEPGTLALLPAALLLAGTTFRRRKCRRSA
ncbi:MAG: DUF1566 domain-containing protein [Rhodocyclaceae bacterium]|nr:DUF1566 domain-containing protein [Rhodocyclaceae bacterium]MBX3668264.1 DUF1566 domain-containing protein [Rhodocyclaceae bacterium]